MVGRTGPEYRTVDEYLALTSPEERTALAALRATIHAAVPDVEEIISYRMPIFTHRGMLVGFAAQTGHLGFYVMSPAVIAAHAKDLMGYDVGKGCIRFSPAKPLPSALVRKLLKARVTENEARSTARRSPARAPRRPSTANR